MSKRGGECVVNRQHSGTGCKGFGVSASQTLLTLLLLFHLLRSQLQGVASVTTTRDSVLICIFPIQNKRISLLETKVASLTLVSGPTNDCLMASHYHSLQDTV